MHISFGLTKTVPRVSIKKLAQTHMQIQPTIILSLTLLDKKRCYFLKKKFFLIFNKIIWISSALLTNAKSKNTYRVELLHFEAHIRIPNKHRDIFSVGRAFCRIFGLSRELDCTSFPPFHSTTSKWEETCTNAYANTFF